MSRWLIFFLASLVACKPEAEQPSVESDPIPVDSDVTPDEPEPEPDEPAYPCGPSAKLLEVVPLDIWGRDLDATLSLAPRPVDTVTVGLAGIQTPLGDEPFELTVIASAEDHLDASVVLSFDGGSGGQALHADTPSGTARVVRGFEEREIGGQLCEVHTVLLGVDHAWFSAFGRAWNRNAVELIMDGEDFWTAAHAELSAASESFLIATWWWESDFELIRELPEHLSLDPITRWSNTIMGMLENMPSSVDRRLLINRFWGNNSDATVAINNDDATTAVGATPDDAFEVIFQGNETSVPLYLPYEPVEVDFSFAERVKDNDRYVDLPLVQLDRPGFQRGSIPTWTLDVASWHQKIMVRDSEVAFVSGFNMKGDDWDTISHDVFDPRRMPFDATEEERRAVLNKEEFPSFVPRKDYGVRIQGPAVADIEDIFEVRWTRAIDDGDYWSEYATPFIPSSPLPEPPDGVPSQVQVTMPAALAERSILDSHLKSIAQAEELLFIEDQYFRSPILVEALVARMLVAPDLHVVVVTKTVPLWDPSTKFTWQADRQLRDLFPDRYSLYQLATMDATVDEGWIWDGVTFHFAEMYLHSKLRIVDDRYFSVGSCNWNNRGYLYEGELNFTLLDADFASQARADAFADMVGPAFADELDGTVEGDLDVLRRAAEYNEGVRIWWEENASSLTADELDSARAAHWPSGTIYPWSLDGYLVEVGPDVF